MRLLGIILIGDISGLGAAFASDEAGVTAEAGLKSVVGYAAKVAHGGISCSLLTSRVHVYAPAYIGTVILTDSHTKLGLAFPLFEYVIKNIDRFLFHTKAIIYL